MRNLSPEEIETILQDLDEVVPRYLPDELRSKYMVKIINPIREKLLRQKVVDHPEVVARIRTHLLRSVQRAVVQPGEGVGVICAQSIGERQTQLTLNSFHQSGLAVATVVTGVPRFLELLNATKDPKMSSVSFRLKSKNGITPQKIREILSSDIVNTSLQDFIRKEFIVDEKEEEPWYTAFETVYTNRFRDFQYCISLQLNTEKMHQHKISLHHIASMIEKQYSDLCCVFSPLHIGQMDIFVDTSNITLPDPTSLPSFLTPDNYKKIYLEDIVKPRLMEIKLSGLQGITNFHILKKDEGFTIETEGSNLEGIVMLPYVDVGSVRSNNMWDILKVMGIEATREFLIEEFTSIVSSDGTFINPVHILLLVDIMTHHGTINSVSRYGLKKEQVGVLSRSSFEESLDHFCNAGFYSEKEPVKAVSAAIMCGKRSKIGSGLCSLLMDWEKINQNTTKTIQNNDLSHSD